MEQQNAVKSWIDVEFHRIKNQRAMFERQWHINLAFYQGRQNIAPINMPNGGGFRLISPKVPPWRVRLVINKIRNAVRTECSKLTSSKPMPVVIPATTEDEDYAAARVAEAILKSEFGGHDFEKTIRSWIWWGVITGNSFLKSYWAPNELDEKSLTVPAPNPIEMMMGQQPEPEPARGKIMVERVTPFHIYVPDLLEEDLELQPFVIHAMTKSPLWVKDNYGFAPTPDARSSQSLYETAVLNPVGATNQGFDSCLLKEVWIKPGGHANFPEGGLVTVVGDRVVQYIDKWPVPFTGYPFYKYDGMPSGGFYCESTVTDLIPLQKEYNRTKSQIVEIKNTMGKPKLMGFKGSFDPRKVSSEPGQAILVTPGFQLPTVLPAAEVPQTMQIELDRLNSDFDDISGQHEITRGNTPAQVTSGTAISFLQEQDDSKLAYQVASIEHAVGRLGEHFLKYALKYWDDQRTVRIVGTDGYFETLHWKQNTLRGNTDVRIQAGSALPVSKAARQALITDLMTQGIIPPETGLEMMEIGGLDKILEDHLIDKRSAQRENMKLASADPVEIAKLVLPPVGPDGLPVTIDGPNGPITVNPETQQPWMPQSPLPVNSWDNHQAHILYHNQFRKTQQFELLPEPIKQAFELHVQTHQMAIMNVQMGAAGVVANPEMAPEQQDPNAPQEGTSGPPVGEGTDPSGGEATPTG